MTNQKTSPSTLTVAVRIRPLNSIETKKNCSVVVSALDEYQLAVINPKNLTEKPFLFDHVFANTVGCEDTTLCSESTANLNDYMQSKIYSSVGEPMLDHAWNGYNVCILAYGQTSSGKSFTMMGGRDRESRGIIPRLTEDLFHRVVTKGMAEERKENFSPGMNSDQHCENSTASVEVSYLEIYNEKVRDLLNPNNKNYLRVREHPVYGPYVEDLSKQLVTSHDDVERLIDEGNKARTVASTNMNEVSSRSHAIFNIVLTQSEEGTETQSKISLVDLAGSERASVSNQKERLKEGSNINKSLTTLGKIISGLSENSKSQHMNNANKRSSKTPSDFIPYRESVLTWLLKENLGGNSRTTMIATVSPASANYEETLSTLRYAERAKNIVCEARVNEDPNKKLIRELKEEIHRLQSIIANQSLTNSLSGALPTFEDSAILEKLTSSEKLLREVDLSYEEKMKRTAEIEHSRATFLKEVGLVNQPGTRQPIIINLHEDEQMSERLVYCIQLGLTVIGSSAKEANIVLPGIDEKHCEFSSSDDQVNFSALGGNCFVNGELVNNSSVPVKHNDRLIIGLRHVFRIQFPFLEPGSINGLCLNGKNKITWQFVCQELKEVSGINLKRSIARSQSVDKEEIKNLLGKYKEKMAELEKERNLLKNEKEELMKKYETLNNYQKTMEVMYRNEIDSKEERYKEEIRNYEEALIELQSQLQDIEEETASSLSRSLSNNDEFVSPSITEENIHVIRNCFTRWKNFKMKELRQLLIEYQPLIEEANSISRKCERSIEFKLKLVSESFYTSVPIEVNQNDCSTFGNKYVVVKVTDSHNGLFFYWSLDHFNKKLQLMRQLVGSNQSLKGTSSSQVRQQNGETESPGSNSPKGSPSPPKDPFYDRTPWFHKLGKAIAYISNVMDAIPFVIRVPIVNERAEIQGYLRVATQNVPNLETPEIVENSDVNEYEKISFRITVLEAMDIPTKFTDIFCQFSVPGLENEQFSTDPIKNEEINGGGPPLGFFHVENISLPKTEMIGKILKETPVLFEVFGHYNQHPLHKQNLGRQQRLLSIVSPNFVNEKGILDRRTSCCYNKGGIFEGEVIVSLEILEVDYYGQFRPVHVEKRKSGQNVLQLHQGMQRRIILEVTHPKDRMVVVSQVISVSVGDIVLHRHQGSQSGSNRKSESDSSSVTSPDDSSTSGVLSANQSSATTPESTSPSCLQLIIIKQHYVQDYLLQPTFQVECAWDSTLHECDWLNQVTRTGDVISMKVIMVLQLESYFKLLTFDMQCSLSMKGTIGLQNTIASYFSYHDLGCVTNFFDLRVRKNSELGDLTEEEDSFEVSEDFSKSEKKSYRRKPVLPLAIMEYEMNLEKLCWIAEVEKTRHFLALSEKRKEKYTLSASCTSKKKIVPLEENEEDRNMYLIQKCLALLMRKMYCSIQRQISQCDSLRQESVVSFPEDVSQNASPTSFRATSTHSANKVGSRLSRQSSVVSVSRPNLLSSFTVPDLARLSNDSSLARMDSHGVDSYTIEVTPVTMSQKNLFEGPLVVQIQSKRHGTHMYGRIQSHYLLITSSSADWPPKGIFNLKRVSFKMGRSQEKLLEIKLVCRGEMYLLRFKNENELDSWLSFLSPTLLSNGSKNNVK